MRGAGEQSALARRPDAPRLSRRAEIAATLDQMARFAALAEVGGKPSFRSRISMRRSATRACATSSPTPIRKPCARCATGSRRCANTATGSPCANSVIATLAQDVPELEGDAHDTRLAS